MRLVALIVQFAINRIVIVGCIQTQVLRLNDRGFWTSKIEGIKGRVSWAVSLSLWGIFRACWWRGAL